MPDDVKLTGACRQLKLSGTTFRVGPLSDRDVVEIETYFKDQHREETERSAETLRATNPEAAARLLSDAVMVRAAINIHCELASAMTTTRDGITLITFLRAKRQHPDLKYDELYVFFKSRDNKMAALNSLALMYNDEEHAGEAQKKTPATPRRGKPRKPTPTRRRS